MNLYIMTRGRVGKQYTLSRLPERWLSKTYLVCPANEMSDHIRNHPMRVKMRPAPNFVANYSQKFQWILDGCPVGNDFGDVLDLDDKAVILDDDLVFSRREGGKLKTITDPELVGEMFDYMEHLLDDYPLVGVHPRQMGHYAKPPFVENGRIICMQGINRRLIGPVKVDQFPILADVVLNCTILSRGQKNAILTTHFQDHGPCQAPGGCSVYRTPAMHRAAMEYVTSRFAPFLSPVERKTKDKWLANEEGVRYDYKGQWKRLYAAGVAHVLDPGKVRHPDAEARGADSPVVG